MPPTEPSACLREPPITLDFSKFSDDYIATVSVDEVSKFTGANGAEYVSWFRGLITVADSNDEILIEQPTLFRPEEENCETGRVATNVYNWPYGTASGLIYDDFNLDGIDDLALMGPETSCYGLPAYTIYLGTNARTFDQDPILTDLASSYCGMFLVSEQAETIGVMTKSGAAWHLWRTYEVIDYSPMPLHEVETQHWPSGYELTLRWFLDGDVVSESRVLVLDGEEEPTWVPEFGAAGRGAMDAAPGVDLAQEPLDALLDDLYEQKRDG